MEKKIVIPSIKEFLELSNLDVAKIVQDKKQTTCVFPFNGTRRWFVLEHADKLKKNFIENYVEETTKAYVNTYKLLFEHGIENVVAPVFGSEILNRGEEYMEQIGVQMALLANHKAFISLYQEFDIQVHFYGDYCQEFQGTKYSYILEQFDSITRQTSHHKKGNLFYGVFASDTTESISKISINHYLKTSKPPTRKEIIEAYYGKYIEKASFFIGFEKFSVYDYPMLHWGEESLYFTVAPSLYITKNQFRHILYDHIYLRSAKEPNYSEMSSEDWKILRNFYNTNREVTLGVGEIRNGIWYSKSNIKE